MREDLLNFQAPIAEVYSCNLEYACVKWLQAAGDPQNTWSYPLPGTLLYLSPTPISGLAKPIPTITQAALDGIVRQVGAALGRRPLADDLELAKAIVAQAFEALEGPQAVGDTQSPM